MMMVVTNSDASLMTTAESHAADLRSEVARAAASRFPAHRLEGLDVLPGGHSGLTHVATLGGPEDPLRVVVKSTPPGRSPVGRHDVLRQARIMRALKDVPGVPTPEVLFSSDTPLPLFGMRLVEGFSAEPVMEDPLPHERAEAVTEAWCSAVDLLVGLQRPTPDELGLGAEPVTSPAQELERWQATMRAGELDANRRAPELADRLAASAPELARPCVVHGDFRLGNMLQRDGSIAALVDWEIWSIGDPRSDLGWLMLFTTAENFPGLGRTVPGTPSAGEIVARYLDAAPAGTGEIAWFRALACFKLAAIQAHNLRRHLEGRYHDPHQERLVASTGALLERGLRLLSGEEA
jgi:aminoglycoside phosphotransferase (APT) family kinase protein